MKAAYDKYKMAGIEDITLKLFPGYQHEILNELDKERIYQEIYQWIDEKM